MKSKLLFLILGLVLINAARASDPPAGDGKTLFLSRCASCHNVNKLVTGPALAGIDERRSMEWIINFVKSSQSMVKNGDKDAVALFEKFKIPMPDHPDLTSENIKSIVEYIKSESKPVDQSKSAFAKPSVKKPVYFPFSFTTNLWPSIGLLVAVLLLMGTFLFALKVKVMKRKAAEKKWA